MIACGPSALRAAARIAIVFAQVHSVGARGPGQRDVVVDDQRQRRSWRKAPG